MQGSEIMNFRHDFFRGENFGLLAQPSFTISGVLVFSRRNRIYRGEFYQSPMIKRQPGGLVHAPQVPAILRAPRPCAVYEHSGISSQNAGLLLSDPGLALILGCRGAALTQGGTADERGAARPRPRLRRALGEQGH